LAPCCTCARWRRSPSRRASRRHEVSEVVVQAVAQGCQWDPSVSFSNPLKHSQLLFPCSLFEMRAS
jgi:hypothetical protein